MPELNGEIIYVQSQFFCQKIRSKGNHFNPLKGKYRTFKIEFGKHLSVHLELPVRVIFHSTSYKNSFGVEHGEFNYGKPFTTEVLLNHHAMVSFEPKKIQYLKEKRINCKELTFYEVVEDLFVTNITELCPNPCSPILLPNETREICPPIDNYDYHCALEVINNVIYESEYDRNPCSIVEYHGKLLDLRKIDGMPIVHSWYDRDKEDADIVVPNAALDINPGDVSVMFSYKFEVPETLTIEVESYVVTFVDLIGIVGGTLGVFIGFAFYDNIIITMDYCIWFVDVDLVKKLKIRKKKIAPKVEEKKPKILSPKVKAKKEVLSKKDMLNEISSKVKPKLIKTDDTTKQSKLRVGSSKNSMSC